MTIWYCVFLESLVIIDPLNNIEPSDHLNPAILIEFLNKKGNILFFANSKLSNHWREFTTEFGVAFQPADTLVIDYPSVEITGDPLVVSSRKFATSAKNIFDASKVTKEQRVFFSGIGHTLSKRSPLLIPVLMAPSTSYSYEPSSVARGKRILAGKEDMALVSSLQARNNARISFIGSTDLLSSKYVAL
jgi:oligosaccharyltransferase complex subunit beta